MNDVSLAENVVIAVRNAAMQELTLNAETEKPTLQSILEFEGNRMARASSKSTPRANTQIYSNTCEGSELIAKFMDDDSEDTMARRTLAKEQTGMKIPLRSSAASASASVDEDGGGTYSVSEKPQQCGPWLLDNVNSKQAQSAEPYLSCLFSATGGFRTRLKFCFFVIRGCSNSPQFRDRGVY